ncbi:Uncharacterized protein TCM_045890 [Theobroma cacao]|uniref:Uncharacterized protein n=1 Tax=Theobroma cacao TaxID=3641 RepID=S1RW64_THECC|nr:Uncharacterized protein TCM_045890 [Theobroma cacao]
MRLRTFSMRRRVARMVLRKSRFNIRYKHKKKNGTKDLKQPIDWLRKEREKENTSRAKEHGKVGNEIWEEETLWDE